MHEAYVDPFERCASAPPPNPATYGCRRYHIRLQARLHTVAASASYGCRIEHAASEQTAEAAARGSLHERLRQLIGLLQACYLVITS